MVFGLVGIMPRLCRFMCSMVLIVVLVKFLINNFNVSNGHDANMPVFNQKERFKDVQGTKICP